MKKDKNLIHIIHEEDNKMIVVTTETIPGRNFEVIGTVKGSTIQTVNAFKDIGSSLKTFGLYMIHLKVVIMLGII